MPHGDVLKSAAGATGGARPPARGGVVLVGGFPTSRMKVGMLVRLEPFVVVDLTLHRGSSTDSAAYRASASPAPATPSNPDPRPALGSAMAPHNPGLATFLREPYLVTHSALYRCRPCFGDDCHPGGKR